MSGQINRRLKELEKQLNQKELARQAFGKFKEVTPIAQERGGNARRNTKLIGNEIQANYSYASVLDQGRGVRDGQMRGSEQAPKGMSDPTIKYIESYIAKVNKG
jgi:hypothetical protein